VELDLHAKDFTDSFAKDGPLDKLDIFNILVLTGVDSYRSSQWCLRILRTQDGDAHHYPPLNSSADASNPVNDVIDNNLVPLEKNCAFFSRTSKSNDPVTGKEICPSFPAAPWRASLLAPISTAASGRRPPGSKPPSTTPRASSSGQDD